MQQVPAGDVCAATRPERPAGRRIRSRCRPGPRLQRWSRDELLHPSPPTSTRSWRCRSSACSRRRSRSCAWSGTPACAKFACSSWARCSWKSCRASSACASGWDVTFDTGRISYRETIAAPVEGVGHFEPLRHYAEVHLILAPLPQGSGLVFDTVCSEDVLDRNWQRLILTHLQEKQHLGVLTGSPVTDLRITLAAGRAI